MTTLVPFALVGWMVVSVALFAKFSARRAILISVIGGWMFLPVASIPVRGFVPDLTKNTAILAGVLGGMFLFDRASFLRFRPSWLDAPMCVWVLAPFMSSLTNGLGVYDGLSAVLENLLAWGIPYGLGRIYFFETDALRDLTWGIFIGGLVYVPLCWFEIVFGPQLHLWVYGTALGGIEEAFRLGGWRPILFMTHGLMTALWMATASVCGSILFFSHALTRWGPYRGAAAVLLLLVTTFALKSVNAWLLTAFALGLLFVSVRLNRAWLLWGAMSVGLGYLFVRVTGLWDGFVLGIWVYEFAPGKSESVLYRLVNEIQIVARAHLQPLWGWGRWGRAFVAGPGGLELLIPDSLWFLALGQQGFVGLGALVGILFLPALLLSVRASPAQWLSKSIAPVTACAFVVLVFAFDSFANAMLIPVYLLAAGGVVGWFQDGTGFRNAVPSRTVQA
jgi:hypothetical protein